MHAHTLYNNEEWGMTDRMTDFIGWQEDDQAAVKDHATLSGMVALEIIKPKIQADSKQRYSMNGRQADRQIDSGEEIH